MRRPVVALLGLALLGLSGCYWNETIAPNEVGIQISSGRIANVVGEGLYTDLNLFSSLERIRRDPIDFEVNDPQVATREKQLVGVKLNIKVQRPSEPERVAKLWRDFNNLARDDKAIPAILDGPARQSIKVNVADFTLDELLADRNRLREAIYRELDARAQQYSLDVLSVDVSDIALEPRYAEELQKRQLVVQQRLTAEQEQLLIKQQTENERFKAEQDKQTRLAEAQRDREVATLQAQKEREVALIEADKRKQVAALEAEAVRLRADAQAYEVQKVAASLSPEYVEYVRSSRWDGRMPTSIYGTQPLPFLDVTPGSPTPAPAATTSGG